MPLSAAPVQLLNLSKEQLLRVSTQHGVEVGSGATKSDLIRQLSDQLSPSDLVKAAQDYLYAGRTSVSWVQFSGGSLTLARLRKAIVSLHGADPFASDLRPELDTTPRLLAAKGWRHGKVVLTFAIRGPEKLVFHGFELRESREDVSLQAIFRLADAAFEIRSSHLHAQKLQRGFVQEIATQLDREPSELALGEPQFDALRGDLGASVTEYTGLDEGPTPYGTRSVTKKDTVLDLAAEPQFQEEYGDLPTVGAHLAFVGADGEDVKARIALRASTIFFVSAVPEATIDMVYSTLRRSWT